MKNKILEIDAGLNPESEIQLTWLGNATITIESGGRSIVIDPYLYPSEGSYQYIFCTHEHYDHASPETVKRLIGGQSFKKVILPRSCLYPSTRFFSRQLAFLEPEHYQILYPKHYDHSATRTTNAEYVGYSETITDDQGSIFPGPDELWLDDWHIEGVEMVGEDAEVPFPIAGLMPQLGYFIEDLKSGVSFYHFGDNHWTYPEMAGIQDRLDIMLLPIGKMGLEEDAKAIEYMKPTVIIPIHWRDAGGDYPIPKLYEGHEPPDQQIRAHHIPEPGDHSSPGQPESPSEYIREVAKLAKDRGAEVVQLKATLPYLIQ